MTRNFNGLSVGLIDVLLFFAESPAEFFAENKNIAGFDNVSVKRVMFNSIANSDLWFDGYGLHHFVALNVHTYGRRVDIWF